MRREVVVGRHLASRRGFLKMTAALAGAGIVNAQLSMSLAAIGQSRGLVDCCVRLIGQKYLTFGKCLRIFCDCDHLV